MGAMGDELDDAVRAIERTIEASVALRKNLQTGEIIGRKMIRKLTQGTPASQSVAASGANPADVRQQTNELLNNFERCRRQMRMVFVLRSLDEGMTIGEVGRSLGVSRQLAARLVKEARAEFALDNGTSPGK
jgi:DNA-directed RNA polymerase specialized sigma24 family protein